MSTASLITTVVLLAGTGLGIQYWNGNKSLDEATERQTRAAGRLRAAQAKLESLDQKMEEVEAQWSKAEATASASAELAKLTSEVDAKRTEWQQVRDEFEGKLQAARKAVQGKKLASVKLKTGLVLTECMIKEANGESISLEHSGGITRVKAGDLEGGLTDYLMPGWNPQLPEALKVPEEIADLPTDEPTGNAPPPLVTKAMTEEQRLARLEKIKARLAWLAPRIRDRKAEVNRAERSLSMTLGRYEAARMLGNKRQFNLQDQIKIHKKEIFEKNEGLRRAEIEAGYLRREMEVLNKVKKNRPA